MSDLSPSRSVQSRQDFVRLLSDLRRNFEQGKSEWENDTLGAYLEAMEAWAADMDGGYAHHRRTSPDNESPWQVAADVLMAGRIYE